MWEVGSCAHANKGSTWASRSQLANARSCALTPLCVQQELASLRADQAERNGLVAQLTADLTQARCAHAALSTGRALAGQRHACCLPCSLPVAACSLGGRKLPMPLYSTLLRGQLPYFAGNCCSGGSARRGQGAGGAGV